MISDTVARAHRVLVVDDDEGVTQTFAQILRLEGYEVRTANNAVDALLEFGIFDPDAILLDVRMPMVNGFGFLYRLRSLATGRNVPVALITADYLLDDDASNELRDLGAQLWLKPLWSEDLVGLTDALLGRAAPRGSSRAVSFPA